jgi:hypothetical protein
MRTNEETKVIEKLIDLIADEADFEIIEDCGLYFPEDELQWNCYANGDIT